MPKYDYKCRKCGHEFEAYRNIFSSDKEVKCPGCGQKEPERKLSIFSSGSSGGGCGPSSFRGFG